MSFGLKKEDEHITELIRYAHSQNVLIFAAASNSGSRRAVAYPAMRREVFCINACDGTGKRANFTPPARPNKANFSMLGVSVLSTWPDFPDADNGETMRSRNI